MQCNFPRWLEKYDMFIPCGKCRACRIARCREWATRLMHESDYHQKNVFVTLTYSPEHVPATGSIEKAALQRFFKRLRHAVEGEIKYYACGEYGEKTKRPHYHAIIFGLGLKDKPIISQAWKYGHIGLGTVTYDSCRYVADYLHKQINGKNEAMFYMGKQKPFNLMSKGIGKQYVLDNKEQLLDNLGCTVRGEPVGLPKYYRKQLEIPTEVLYEKSLERLDKVRNHYTAKYNDDIWSKVQKSRRQSELNTKAKQELKNKGRF